MSKSKYVTLESADGFVFVVEREAAYVSGTLRGILESNCEYEHLLTDRDKLTIINEKLGLLRPKAIM